MGPSGCCVTMVDGRSLSKTQLLPGQEGGPFSRAFPAGPGVPMKAFMLQSGNETGPSCLSRPPLRPLSSTLGLGGPQHPCDACPSHGQGSGARRTLSLSEPRLNFLMGGTPMTEHGEEWLPTVWRPSAWVSVLLCSRDVAPWASYSSSLRLSFIICELGGVAVPTSQGCGGCMRSGHTPRTVSGTEWPADLFGVHHVIVGPCSVHCRQRKARLFLLLVKQAEGILDPPSRSRVVLSQSGLLAEPQCGACEMGANSPSDDGAEV